MPDAEIELSVIIVSYNTAAMTAECLRGAEAEIASLRAEILLVDNASTDGTLELVDSLFPRVRVIANATNAGFGAANNQALAVARGEFLLLLNSDAFPLPGAIQALVTFLRENKQVGAVGPRLLNKDRTLQRSCWRFPSPGRAWLENIGLVSCFPNHPVIGDYSRWDHNAQRDVEFVIGACLLVRREVYAQVGGFDERFFMYAEECDWQRRIRAHGWRVTFTPAAEVYHLGGASGAAESARISRHFFESLDAYTRKHHGMAGLVSLRGAMVVGSFLRALGYSLLTFLPQRRKLAINKTRLHLWLLRRQAFHWISPISPAGSGRITT